jgi:phosphate transport system substrate-binding protein
VTITSSATRFGRLAGVALAATLALAACGSDNNSPGSSASGGAGISCQSGSIKASGSTAQKNAMTEWVNAYQEACTGATINYTASGSGAGVTDFINNQTAFAGSDSALSAVQQPLANKRCATGSAIDLPMVVGPIAVGFNLSGVSTLVLTPDVIAKIFANQITMWNDPAIASINAGATLPAATIVSFHRSDSSGTTDNFTHYLSVAAASAWTYGHDKVWKAPGGQGAKGSDGVAAALKSTPNSIGYVEYSFTQQGGIGVAQVNNGAGAVTLSPQTAAAAAAQATVIGVGSDLALKIDYATTAAGAYPIILVTYEITCQKGLSSSDLALTKSFLTYTASSAGQAKLNATSGYAPLPASLVSKVQADVASIS